MAASISCGQYRAPDLTVGSPDQWQMVDLPGVSGGSRAAAYDPGRDCLWILTRYFRQAGHPQVSLTQLNVRTHAATSIPLSISAAGFIQGSIIVDPSEHVWMSWGRNLVAYDPSEGASRGLERLGRPYSAATRWQLSCDVAYQRRGSVGRGSWRASRLWIQHREPKVGSNGESLLVAISIDEARRHRYRCTRS